MTDVTPTDEGQPVPEPEEAAPASPAAEVAAAEAEVADGAVVEPEPVPAEAAPEAAAAEPPEAAPAEASPPEGVQAEPAAEAATEVAPSEPALPSAPAARPSKRREKRPKPLTDAVGRRKEAVARLRIRAGSGTITVNGRPIETYFSSETHRTIVTEALRLTTTADVYDVDATIAGGGVSGQAGALRLGIARALVELDPEVRVSLKRAGLLSRDAREKESKKYGLKKARKAPQYSKR